MSARRKRLSLSEWASAISTALEKAGVHAVLTGGAVVSIYSENEYQSSDLDFVTSVALTRLDPVMHALGFRRQSGRHYENPACEWLIEFPPGPVMLGDQPVARVTTRRIGRRSIRMLTPSQCVMDRLAAFYHWNDRQCLDQAVMVARRHRIGLAALRRWSRQEGQHEKFEEFIAAFKRRSTTTRRRLKP